MRQQASELGKLLLDIVPRGLDAVFYTDFGSMSVEVVLEVAVQYWVAKGRSGKSNIATVLAGYHGDTWNAISVCDPVIGMHGLFGPALPGRPFVSAPQTPFGGTWDAAGIAPLEHLFVERTDELAAFIIELVVQDAGSVRFYHLQYLANWRGCHGLLARSRGAPTLGLSRPGLAQ